MNIKRLLYSEYSDVVISIILGFGLATMFRKICNERNCIVFHAPSNEEMENQVFRHNNECYKFDHKSAQCSNDKKKIYFA
jgi:hypothetical protein